MFPFHSLTSSLSLSVLCLIGLNSCGLRLPIQNTEAYKNLSTKILNQAPTTTQVSSPTQAKPKPTPNQVDVWVIADHFHTGVVFSYPWLKESGFVPPANFGNPKYVTLSWGNRDAYSKAGIDNPYKFFRVLFTPTPSVMELIAFDYDVTYVCPYQRIWKQSVPRAYGPALAHYLNDCSKTDSSGRPIVVCESSWGKGVQLESKYPYFIPRVCNVWTTQSLESLGFEINPWLGLTANGLARQLEGPPNHFIKIWNGKPKP